jgi:hypothetical protein
MRPIILFLALFISTQTVNAQFYEHFRTLLVGKKYKAAKDTLDKLMLQPINKKNKDLLYMSALADNFYSHEVSDLKLAENLKNNAFNSFKTCLTIDPAYKQMALDDNKYLFDVYSGLFQLGGKWFKQQAYEKAYAVYVKAYDVQQFIYFKGLSYKNYKFKSMDTVLIQNLALSARLGLMQKEAIANYQRLADAKIGGKGFLEVYQYLCDTYRKQKNETAFTKVLATARKLYPENDFWDEAALDYITPTATRKELFAKYQELIADNPNAFSVCYNYCSELYNTIYTANIPTEEKNDYKARLDKYLSQAIALQKNSTKADLLQARHLYNSAFDLQGIAKRLVGENPAIATQRDKLKEEAFLKVRACIGSAERVYNFYVLKSEIKEEDKINFKQATDLLYRCYTQLDNKEKTEFYKSKLALFDKGQ